MELKESIIMATIEAFRNKGLRFTMDDIAKTLNISKKTVYTVFDSKEDLLNGVADYSYCEIKKKEQEILNQDMDIVDKIKAVIIALPDSYSELDLRKLGTLKDKYPAIHEKVVLNIENNWESTMELMNEGIRQGRIRPVNLNIFKQVVSSTIEHFISSDELMRNNIGYRVALEEMMNIVMEGIVK